MLRRLRDVCRQDDGVPFMIPISEALKIIERETFLLESETIDLSNSIGRVLAEEIRADMDLPPFDRSQMDGFAVRNEDTKNAGAKNPVKLKIIGESVAGKGFEGIIKNGETVRIMTGAPVPKGADSVQKVELTRENEGFVEILEATKPKQNIVNRAEEIKIGESIFSAGEIITENMIASLASFGYANVKVSRKPRAAILATGSEIVEITKKPKQDQIRNSNSIMLKVFAEKAGAEVKILSSVKDKISDLKFQISEAAGLNNKSSPNGKLKTQNSEFKILIITGGVSVGDYDFTKPALRELGAEIFFEKISLKPGKPTVFAKLNDKLIFGLPGNPVSVAVTFHLFVRTALLKMQNANECELKRGFAVVSEKIKGAKERDSFLPVFVETNAEGKLLIKSLRFSGSSNFIAFSRANALVFVPQNSILQPGDIAQIAFLP
ncbi:MAG TPA: gephyrin-like molybdotransferase Glp [Pyrinomonadaceae bacterium]|nr:gephyrin-like molybdotransferase Glp [Pyrinomonadaceae bacterium]